MVHVVIVGLIMYILAKIPEFFMPIKMHPKPSLHNRDDHVNFLEESRSLMNTVKALVGSQQTSTTPPPMAFAGYQAQQFLPHQECPVIPQQ